MKKQTVNAIIFRTAAILLCALLVGASLDAIPDPPAVMQHQQQNLVTCVHQSRVLPIKVVPLFLTALAAVQPQQRRVTDSDVLVVTDNVTFLSQASDTSPPSIP